MARSGEPRVLPLLIEGMGNKDAHVRGAMVAALSHAGGACLVELLKAAAHSDPQVRAGDVCALGRSKDARSVMTVRQALKDREQHVRLAAIESIGQLRDAGAVDPLTPLLADADPKIRVAAAAMLAILGRGQWSQCVKGENGDFVRLAGLPDPQLSRDLRLAAWSHVGADGRVAVLAAMYDRKDPAVETLAIHALRDEDASVRLAAAKALG